MDIPNQEIIGSATYSEIMETARFLASNPDEREKLEKEWNEELPKGFSVTIDLFGIAHLTSPLYVSSLI